MQENHLAFADLSLRYVDGMPALVVSGGKAIPASLTVVDGGGNVVAAYTAGPLARARSLAQKGGGELLEPIMAVEVVTPEDYMGDVMGDLDAGTHRLNLDLASTQDAMGKIDVDVP